MVKIMQGKTVTASQAGLSQNWIAKAFESGHVPLVAVLVLMVVFFSVTSEHFFTATTLQIISNQIPTLTVIAVGMTFVLIIAGIDLSVGSILAVSGMVLSTAILNWGLSQPLAILCSLLAGLCCGLVNGVISARWRIPSFIVTLGMLEIARGGAYLISDSRTQYIGSDIGYFSAPLAGGISPAFMMAVLLVIAGQLLLTRTVLGRQMVGVGCNEEVMRLSGINTAKVKITVFAISGLMAALGAVFYVSRLEAANPNAGEGLELQAIAAVVIGGTSLMGGRGSVVSTFLGVLIISVLAAGLAQIGASDPLKRLITGAVIIMAVILDIWRSKGGKQGRQT